MPLALTLAVLTPALTTPGAGAETPYQTCDRLAAIELDRDNTSHTPPVDFSDIDVKRAVPACRAAVAQESKNQSTNQPQNRRSLMLLGRALDAADAPDAKEVAERAAALGSTRAMFNLAFNYANGRYGPRDEAKAKQLMLQIAQAGDLELASTGIMLLPSQKAFFPLDASWYEKAAAAGYPGAIMNLAETYDDAGDHAKALPLYRKAAESGDPNALYNLGAFLSRGHGVAPDPAETLRLYKAAAAQGQRFALDGLGQIYRKGRGVPRDYAQARKYFEKAAAQDLASAMVHLGDMDGAGEGGPQDYAAMRRWYERAAALEHEPALYALGVMYDRGEGVRQNYAAAKGWFEKAAAQGSALAMHNLGFYARMGYGGPVDHPAARRWYRAAAQRGDEESMYRLAALLDDDDASKPADLQEARMWLEKAAAAHHVKAMALLGYFEVLGKGGPTDRAAARRLFEAAAAEGDASAKKGLAIINER